MREGRNVYALSASVGKDEIDCAVVTDQQEGTCMCIA